MASANTTNQLPLLKRLWGDKVAEPLYKRSKFLASIKKDTDFGGEGRYVNVTIGPTAGGSADFATALANQDATSEKRFFVTHRKEYQVFSIQGDLIARSRGNKNAVLESVKQQADKARYAFFRSMAARAWGNAGGALGVISSGSTVSSTTITLATRADVVRFEPNMRVTAADDDGSAASPAGVLDNGTQLTITAINRSTGTLTASAAWNTIAGIAAGDYIHRAGDYSLAMTGTRGWAPVSDPSASENFFGLDRTLGDIQRLSGIRVSGSGGSKEETLISAGAEAQMAGAESKLVFCNPLDLADLVKEQGSKVVYQQAQSREAGIGFDVIKVHTPVGNVGVTSEPDVPKGYAWMLDTDEITLRTAGDCPMMLNEDGVGKLMRSATDDSYQGRLGCYGNFFFENPGHSVIITW
jgi:hypothetical protein